MTADSSSITPCGKATISTSHGARLSTNSTVGEKNCERRRQSRFFSPTVEYVLKKAPCEVLIVAFPQGVIEEESATL